MRFHFRDERLTPGGPVAEGNFLRRRWTVLTAVVVVVIAGFAVYRLHGIFGSTNVVSRPSADSLDNTGYNPKRVLFEVFGSPESVATINYLDEKSQPQRVDNVPLPWSHPLTTNDPTLFADLRARNGNFISCQAASMIEA